MHAFILTVPVSCQEAAVGVVVATAWCWKGFFLLHMLSLQPQISTALWWGYQEVGRGGLALPATVS